MPSLERFFDPQMRKFDANVRPLPGARLYFFESGTTTPKTTYQDKQGKDAHTNPVIADSTGVFPQIFLDGLYRVELRSSANIVQPGWPIDNIGQDTPVVPFGPWVEVNTYNEGEVVTGSNGNWYRSITDNNLGNDPIYSPTEWEVIPIPVASSYTSNKAYLTWADDGDQVSLNVDSEELTADVVSELSTTTDPVVLGDNLSVSGNLDVTGSSEFTGSASFLADVKAENGKIQIGPDAGPKFFINSDGEASDDDSSYLTLARRSSTRVELGGDFQAGEEIILEKIDSTVTITSNTRATHSSSSVAISNSVIPSEYRPGTEYTSNLNDIQYSIATTGYITTLSVTYDGKITMSHRDYSGAPINQVNAGCGISFSYTITSDTP